MTSTAVLCVSGALGFLVVALGFPDWQVAVETAQVIAGLVEYPRDNSFYIYHRKLWTVLHQICALLLRAGVSEIALSMLLTGIQGMLTFQALAMFVYALSRDGVLALASTVVIIVSGTADVGVTYPIFLLGTVHTYGAMGLSVVVLAAALLGCGHHRLGLFLTGIAPAIHPSLGLWLALVLIVCFALDAAGARRILADGWRAFAAGCAVSAVSLAVHFFMARGIPPVPSDVTARYLDAFTALWDEHRQPVRLTHMGVRINLAALALAGVWLAVRRGADGNLILRFVAVTVAVSIGFVFLSWIPPDRLPKALVILMPTRLLNVGTMTFTAMVIGLAGSIRRPWTRWMTVALCLLLVVGRRSMLWDWLRHYGWGGAHPRIDPAGVLAAAAVILMVYALVLRRRAQPSAARPILSNTILAALAIVLVWIGSGPVLAARSADSVYRDRTNDLLFQAASRGRGLLLTGGDLYLIQLRTRRPLLLNGGALDSLPYAPESAPVMDRVLRNVYGIDLFNPPAGAAKMAVVPNDYNRTLWQGYSPERWREIKRDYNVSQVMVPADWQLALPIVAQSRQYLLYEIP